MTWTRTSVWVVDGARGKVIPLETDSLGQHRFKCPRDGADVVFPSSSISLDAFGDLTLTLEPTCTSGLHKWSVRFGTTAYVGVVDTTPPSSFTLELTGSNITVQRVSTGFLGVVITRTNMAEDITFSVAGLPSGVTAAFDPNPSTDPNAASTLILTADVTAPLGTYLLTITGTAPVYGPVSTTVTMQITSNIPPPEPSYTLALNPTALTIVQGNASTTTVSLVRTNLTADITLDVTGEPAGVTIGFVPNPATASSSVLTVTVGGAVTPGVYVLTVVGSTPGLTDRTAQLTLTVNAPPAPPGTFIGPIFNKPTGVGFNTSTGIFTGGVLSDLSGYAIPAFNGTVTECFSQAAAQAAINAAAVSGVAGDVIAIDPAVILATTGGNQSALRLPVRTDPTGYIQIRPLIANYNALPA